MRPESLGDQFVYNFEPHVCEGDWSMGLGGLVAWFLWDETY